MDAHNNVITISGLSADEFARLKAYHAHRRAEHNAQALSRGWTPIDVTLDDVAYFLLIRALIEWERTQVTTPTPTIPSDA